MANSSLTCMGMIALVLLTLLPWRLAASDCPSETTVTKAVHPLHTTLQTATPTSVATIAPNRRISVDTATHRQGKTHRRSHKSIKQKNGSPHPHHSVDKKRGILAPGGDDGQYIIANFHPYLKIAWMNTWYSGEMTGIGPRIHFIPQKYGPSDSLSEFQTNAELAIQKHQMHWLAYGEPSYNQYTAQELVNDWVRDFGPYLSRGVKVSNPPETQASPDQQFTLQFMQACRSTPGCHVSFYACHWIADVSGGDTGQGSLMTTIDIAVKQAQGLPIWLDNFQPNGTEADVKTFLKWALPYLDNHPAIAKYSYMSPLRGEWAAGVLNMDGSMSDVGKLYATL